MVPFAAIAVRSWRVEHPRGPRLRRRRRLARANVSPGTASFEVSVETTRGAAGSGFMDHRVAGRAIFPAAGMLRVALDATRAATRRANGVAERTALTNASVPAPLLSPARSRVIVRVGGFHVGHERVALVSASHVDGSVDAAHLDARPRVVAASRRRGGEARSFGEPGAEFGASSERFRARARVPIDPDAAYRAFGEYGLQYGAGFRPIGALRTSSDGRFVAARLEPPAAAGEDAASSSLLDGAAQIAAPIKIAGATLRVPAAIEIFTANAADSVYPNRGEGGDARASIRGEGVSDHAFDADSGVDAARLIGLIARPIRTAATRANDTTSTNARVPVRTRYVLEPRVRIARRADGEDPSSPRLNGRCRSRTVAGGIDVARTAAGTIASAASDAEHDWAPHYRSSFLTDAVAACVGGVARSAALERVGAGDANVSANGSAGRRVAARELILFPAEDVRAGSTRGWNGGVASFVARDCLRRVCASDSSRRVAEPFDGSATSSATSSADGSSCVFVLSPLVFSSRRDDRGRVRRRRRRRRRVVSGRERARDHPRGTRRSSIETSVSRARERLLDDDASRLQRLFVFGRDVSSSPTRPERCRASRGRRASRRDHLQPDRRRRSRGVLFETREPNVGGRRRPGDGRGVFLRRVAPRRRGPG